MARKVFRADLSSQSLQRIVNELNNYQKSIPQKCQKALNMLANDGIKVGVSNTGAYRNHIAFIKRINGTQIGARAIVVGYNTSHIISEWLTLNAQGQEVVSSADVNPLLMAEFGSGWDSLNFHNSVNMQGTFPGQTHAFDAYWHWKDLNGVWHTSDGEKPTMPIYKAYTTMYVEVDRVFKEVFGR